VILVTPPQRPSESLCASRQTYRRSHLFRADSAPVRTPRLLCPELLLFLSAVSPPGCPSCHSLSMLASDKIRTDYRLLPPLFLDFPLCCDEPTMLSRVRLSSLSLCTVVFFGGLCYFNFPTVPPCPGLQFRRALSVHRRAFARPVRPGSYFVLFSPPERQLRIPSSSCRTFVPLDIAPPCLFSCRLLGSACLQREHAGLPVRLRSPCSLPRPATIGPVSSQKVILGFMGVFLSGWFGPYKPPSVCHFNPLIYISLSL